MCHAERLLLNIDRRLQIRRICRSTPRPIAELLEIAYAAVYVVVPIALVVHLTKTAQPSGALFWAVILITDYICFGTLPWIQTRPPRALEADEPWTAAFRAFNLRLLGRTSIHVNTFPSGHAAEGLAAALLVIGAPVSIVAAMLLVGLSVSAGAVLGRYHYATDIVAGWAVAMTVYLLAS
jgi:membrane-associated phospholipid phosphatase